MPADGAALLNLAGRLALDSAGQVFVQQAGGWPCCPTPCGDCPAHGTPRVLRCSVSWPGIYNERDFFGNDCVAHRTDTIAPVSGEFVATPHPSLGCTWWAPVITTWRHQVVYDPHGCGVDFDGTTEVDLIVSFGGHTSQGWRRLARLVPREWGGGTRAETYLDTRDCTQPFIAQPRCPTVDCSPISMPDCASGCYEWDGTGCCEGPLTVGVEPVL